MFFYFFIWFKVTDRMLQPGPNDEQQQHQKVSKTLYRFMKWCVDVWLYTSIKRSDAHNKHLKHFTKKEHQRRDYFFFLFSQRQQQKKEEKTARFIPEMGSVKCDKNNRILLVHTVWGLKWTFQSFSYDVLVPKNTYNFQLNCNYRHLFQISNK